MTRHARLLLRLVASLTLRAATAALARIEAMQAKEER